MTKQYISVEELVQRSKVAQKQFETATQEQADAAAHAICKIVYDNCEMLGTMAQEETRMGNVADKIAKCRNKSSQIWHTLKGEKSVGIIKRKEEIGIVEIAKPMGVVASIVPSTNPVVTPMCNGAFALKTRNSIIFAPHPRAVKCTDLLVELFRGELKKLALPEDLIQVVTEISVAESGKLMESADIIVATGGMAMVKSAYSSGKPALGVGAGNVQCIVDTDADIKDAVGKIITGRVFDYGLICLGEQTVFVPEDKLEEFITEFEASGGFYTKDKEITDKIREGIFPNGGIMNRDVVGQSATTIAKIIGIEVPENTRVIGVTATGLAEKDDLCKEKMCPVLNIMTYKTFEEGVAFMVENLEHEGKGHSVAIHSNTIEHIEYVGEKCSVSRCIVNQPSGTSGGGSPTNGFMPTTTLGCGSWGNNSFSGNLSYKNFLNITRVGYLLEKSYLENVEDAWK